MLSVTISISIDFSDSLVYHIVDTYNNICKMTAANIFNRLDATLRHNRYILAHHEESSTSILFRSTKLIDNDINIEKGMRITVIKRICHDVGMNDDVYSNTSLCDLNDMSRVWICLFTCNSGKNCAGFIGLKTDGPLMIVK